MNGKILAHIGKNSTKASHWLTSLVSSKYSWGGLGGLGGGEGLVGETPDKFYNL